MQSLSCCIRTSSSLTWMFWVAMGCVFWSGSRCLIYRESPDWLHLQLGRPNWSQASKSINNDLIVFYREVEHGFYLNRMKDAVHIYLLLIILSMWTNMRFAFAYQGYVTNQLGSPCWWHTCLMKLCYGQCNTKSPRQSSQTNSGKTNQSSIRNPSHKTDNVCNVYIINGCNHKTPQGEWNQVFRKKWASPAAYVIPITIHKQ